MNKQQLVESICRQIETDSAAAKAAALATYEAATGEESQPENEYDTRALEASYLAGAQAKRVQELDEALAIFKRMELKPFAENDAIGVSALVQLELNRKVLTVFLVPGRRGLTLEHEGQSIQVITMQSPLGEALLGLREGDIAGVETPNRRMEYEVLSVS